MCGCACFLAFFNSRLHEEPVSSDNRADSVADHVWNGLDLAGGLGSPGLITGPTIAGNIKIQDFTRESIYAANGLIYSASNTLKISDGFSLGDVAFSEDNVGSAEEPDIKPNPSVASDVKKAKISGLHAVSFKIKSSIYSDANRAGLSRALGAKIIEAYKGIINFKSGLHKGDRIVVLFSEKGDLKYASVHTRRKVFTLYGYKDSYYDPFGAQVSGPAMHVPVSGARISSKFGFRIHPLYRYRKKHSGVDYAAAKGSDIFAAAAGKIVYLGRRGGYGKCVVIKHNNGYKTLYGHMSSFGANLAVGSYVNKGQIIGKVGMTGLATGPHLHFELIVNGRRVDPMTVKLVSKDIDVSARNKFNSFKKKMDELVHDFSREDLISSVEI